MIETKKWTEDDQYYMSQALKISTMSNDPRTQTGAVIGLHGVRASAHNSFPIGIAETPERWDSANKPNYILHAELGAIYSMATLGHPTMGCVMASTFAPCVECAKGIIAAKISRLVVLQATWDKAPAHWSDSLNHGRALLLEAGVEYIFIDHFFGIEIRFNGETLQV